MKLIHRIVVLLCIVVLSRVVLGRDLYVDPDHGDDHATGLAAQVGPDNAGPMKTIAAAVAVVQPGDTIHLAQRKEPYHQSVILHNVSGEPDRPIIIDGHGATLTGVDPLRPADWTDLGGGLYRSDALYAQLHGNDSVVDRVFFMFGGKVQHMDRTSKGAKAPFKKPEDLTPGEWTFDAATHAFFIRIAPDRSLADAGVEIPYRLNGVAIRGAKNEHLVIRNLAAIHFLNDGFNIHNQSRDLRFENIAAYENGDDGLSAHEACELSVNGYRASGNSTGVCNINRSVCTLNNIRLEGNFGFEFYACESTVFDVHNAVIIATGSANPVAIFGHPKTNQTCTVTMDNVWMISRGSQRRRIDVRANGVLHATRLTTIDLSWNIQGRVDITDSVIYGRDRVTLTCAPDAAWKADRNIYDLYRLKMGEQSFTASDFAAYQKTAQQDEHSQFMPLDESQLKCLMTDNGELFPSVGADRAKMQIPPADGY